MNKRKRNINKITLVDAAFMQFPNEYHNISNAEFIWCIVYLKNRYDNNTNHILPNLNGNPYVFQPIKHSIYSVTQNFNLIMNTDPNINQQITEFQTYLDFCVAYYKI